MIVDPPSRRHAQMPTANTASDHEPRVAHMARQSSYGGPSRTTTSSALLPPDRHPTPHGRTYGTAQNDTVAASYTTLTASPTKGLVRRMYVHPPPPAPGNKPANQRSAHASASWIRIITVVGTATRSGSVYVYRQLFRSMYRARVYYGALHKIRERLN
jgi:hypothetical protein